MLYKSKSSFKVDKMTKQIKEVLADRENKWNEEQTIKMKERIKEKLKKAANQKDYTKKLLSECKSWRGPADSGEDLQAILKGRDNQSHILRTEMSYYVHTHKSNQYANKDLFRLNRISYDEMLENLIILLDGEKHASTATVANLPSNDIVMKSITSINKKPLTTKPITTPDLVNTMCVVVWADSKDLSYSWYLGYVKKHSEDGTFEVDHLTCALKTSDSKWKYPNSSDIQLVLPEQMVKCEIIGQWDMDAGCRKRFFTLENFNAISFACKNITSEF